MNKYLLRIILLSLGILIALAIRDTSSNQSAVSQPAQIAIEEGQEVATFAAGCFWCTEAAFQELEGVTSVISGYAGGVQDNPTYEQVYKQETDHREAVQIIYNPNVITYETLLDNLWPAIDPTDNDGQFVDRGFSYTAAIFYHNESQQELATKSKQVLADSGRFFDREIVTPILPYSTFHEAEDYHQDFYLNSQERYKNYEMFSGREEYKAAIWAEIQAQN